MFGHEIVRDRAGEDGGGVGDLGRQARMDQQRGDGEVCHE